MFIELHSVQQVRDERRRRLFWDDSMDLTVWFEPDGTIHGFQLSYDPEGTPRTLTWSRTRGYSHAGLDTGGQSVLANRSPVLGPDAVADAALLRSGFAAAAPGLPPDIRATVELTLTEWAPD